MNHNKIGIDDVSLASFGKVLIKDDVYLISITVLLCNTNGNKVRFGIYTDKDNKQCRVLMTDKYKDQFQKEITNFLCFVATVYAAVTYPSLFIDINDGNYD